MVDDASGDDEITKIANKLSKALDADLIVLNFEILPPVDTIFIRAVRERRPKKNVILFLTTEGGSADAAFRMMRYLQQRYENVTIAVPGWCKSAGTLMCIGAHDLIMCDYGELGPLDVQISKVDEMHEQKSGLVAEAAFEKLQQESFKFFMQFVRDFGGSEYRVTLKNASDIAIRTTIGVMQPIFDKLDPVTIGEDYRSNRLALAYAERLNVHTRNLKRTRRFDALDNLLSGYESHGFVIDRKEAENLFRKVKPPSAEMVELIDAMGIEAIYPRSRRSEQGPKLEFLNDEEEDTAEANAQPNEEASTPRRPPGRRRRGNGSAELPRNSAEGSDPESLNGAPEA